MRPRLKLMGALSHAPGFADVTTDMDLTAPAANVDIDRDQAAAQGVSVQSIETALGASFGGEQISTLYASDAEYWVMLELLPQYQMDPSSINLLYISSSLGSGSATFKRRRREQRQRHGRRHHQRPAPTPRPPSCR